MVAKGIIVFWLPVYTRGKNMSVRYFQCYFALALSLDLLNITTHESRLFHYVFMYFQPNSVIVNTSCIATSSKSSQDPTVENFIYILTT